MSDALVADLFAAEGRSLVRLARMFCDDQAAAEDLLYSGRSISGEEAVQAGLVDHVDPDPEAAALAYAEQHLDPAQIDAVDIKRYLSRSGK